MLNVDDYLSSYFKNKIDSKTQITELYHDPLFSKYYNNSGSKGVNLHGDIMFYKKHINPDALTLEIASGNGRVISALLEENFNILGVEREQSMINQMEYKYRKYVYKNDIFNFKELNEVYCEADYIIIPATSISLFSWEDIKSFIENLVDVNQSFELIFDGINIESIINKKPFKEINRYGTFYIQNFKMVKDTSEWIIYNIYHKESNKIGYSIKYNHSIESLIDILKRYNISNKIKISNESYYMIVGEYNGK